MKVLEDLKARLVVETIDKQELRIHMTYADEDSIEEKVIKVAEEYLWCTFSYTQKNSCK